MGQNKKRHGGIRGLAEKGFTEEVPTGPRLTKGRRRHLGLRGFPSILPAVMRSLRHARGVGRGEAEAWVRITCPVDDGCHLGV